MDSLLASYASSDDEDESPPTATATAPPPPPASKPLSPALPSPRLFSSLPPPKSLPPLADASKPSPSSLFSVLPPPKSHRPSPIDSIATADDASKPSPSLFSSLPPPKPSPASSLFSSLPPPKPSPLFSSLPPPKPANPPSIPPPKTVVKFTPPIPAPLPNHDSDSDDDTRKRKPNKSSVAGGDGGPRKSSSLLLPAPKNTLCLAPALGGGAAPRRSTLQADTDTPSPDLANSAAVPDPVGFVPEAVTGYEDYGGYDGSWAGGSGDLQAGVSGGEGSGWVPSYGGGEGYVGDWSEGPVVTTAPDLADMERAAGKRARRGVPMEILEVKQDELMKNRPREDQHKVTGVAFGPAYQAVSSSKGKPSKLHKRKHQIGSLYFDMKSKEAELAERRSRGFLTKAETQAKYGW